MSATVRIDDIVDALQMQFDEYTSYLDLDTGSIHTVSLDLLRRAEESEEEDPDLLDWQEDEWVIAKKIVTSDSFKELPSKFDVHEWAIMDEFSRSIESVHISKQLQNAIHGKGAFRMFKDAIRRCGVEKDWYKFRDDALKEIAIDWCEANGIEWR
jgi:hypothetical protein